MKAILGALRGLTVVAALTAGLTATAQSIQFFTLKKVQGFTQTDDGAGNVAANAYNPGLDLYPWRFSTDINGTSLDPTHPTPPNHVATPAGSGVSAFDLNFVPLYGWEYRPGYSTQGAMDAAFNSGSYTVGLANGAATPFNLNLVGDFYAAKPVAALTGGSWVGGVYQLNPASTWSIDSGLFTFVTDADHSRIELDITGTGVNFTGIIGAGSAMPFGTLDTSGSLMLTSLSLGAPTFLAGENYNVTIRYLTATDFQDISAAVGQGESSAFAAALYSSQTSFTIQAIPEPATYAAWAGLLGLGAVVIRRRLKLAS